MARLHERGEQLRDVALVGLHVLLQEGVEVEQQQAVHADGARHDAIIASRVSKRSPPPAAAARTAAPRTSAQRPVHAGITV